jgi:WXG100 family type VII secretion target
LRSLDSTVTGMVGGWTGQSGGAYGDAWGQWHRGAGEVERSLSILARLLETTAQGFASSERDGAQKLRSVPGG